MKITGTLIKNILFHLHALDMKWSITNEVCSTDLVITTLYPTSVSEIIVLSNSQLWFSVLNVIANFFTQSTTSNFLIKQKKKVYSLIGYVWWANGKARNWITKIENDKHHIIIIVSFSTIWDVKHSAPSKCPGSRQFCHLKSMILFAATSHWSSPGTPKQTEGLSPCCLLNFYYDASVDSNHFHKGCRYFPLPSP